ncbi:hypothetical protein BH10PSE16_BH10PSE16_24900 [soil metagenome]
MSASPHPIAPPSTGSAPQKAGWLAGWTSLHTAWLMFAPPAFMVGVSWILQLFTDRQGGTPALPLVSVGTTTGTLDLLWPVLATLTALAAAVWGLRRIGLRRALVVLGAVWVLLWLGGSAAMLQRQLNRHGLLLHGSAAAPVVAARVITSAFKPANLHSLGGTELVLQVSGLEIPQRLLINDPQAVSLKPGDALALEFEPGRFSGLFVTGWHAPLPAAPASSIPAAPAAAS